MLLEWRKAVPVFIVLLTLALAVFLAACGIGGGSDRPIVYVAEEDGNPDVYTIDVESEEPELVKRGPGSEFAPTWSPDGERHRLRRFFGGRPGRDSRGGGGIRGRVFRCHRRAAAGRATRARHGGTPRATASPTVSELNGQSDVYRSHLPGRRRGRDQVDAHYLRGQQRAAGRLVSGRTVAGLFEAGR